MELGKSHRCPSSPRSGMQRRPWERREALRPCRGPSPKRNPKNGFWLQPGPETQAPFQVWSPRISTASRPGRVLLVFLLWRRGRSARLVEAAQLGSGTVRRGPGRKQLRTGGLDFSQSCRLRAASGGNLQGRASRRPQALGWPGWGRKQVVSGSFWSLRHCS